jgi:hypothetical protein
LFVFVLCVLAVNFLHTADPHNRREPSRDFQPSKEHKPPLPLSGMTGSERRGGVEPLLLETTSRRGGHMPLDILLPCCPVEEQAGKQSNLIKFSQVKCFFSI